MNKKIRVYGWHPITKEPLQGEFYADESPLEKGVYHLPQYTTLDIIPKFKEKECVLYNEDLEKWIVSPDFRNTLLFSKIDKSQKVHDDFLPNWDSSYTTKQPLSDEYYCVWEELKDSWVIDKKLLEQFKIDKFNTYKNDKLTLLINKSQEFIDNITESNKTPDFEVRTWPQQAIEAKEWFIDKTIETPLLKNIAINRGIDIDELRMKAYEKSIKYEYAVSSIIGQRQKYEKLIETANSIDEIDSIAITFNLE